MRINRDVHRVVGVEHGPTFTGRGRNREVFDYFVRIWYVSTEGVRGFTGKRAEVVRFDTEAEAVAFAAEMAEEETP